MERDTLEDRELSDVEITELAAICKMESMEPSELCRRPTDQERVTAALAVLRAPQANGLKGQGICDIGDDSDWFIGARA